jgi:hypothetical protein
VNFAAIIFCAASQRVFVVVDFVIDSVRKLFEYTLVSTQMQAGARSVCRALLLCSSINQNVIAPELSVQIFNIKYYRNVSGGLYYWHELHLCTLYKE